METEKTELADQIIRFKDQIKELEKRKLSDDAASNIAKDKASKKMWDEMAKKDLRIEELERYNWGTAKL